MSTLETVNAEGREQVQSRAPRSSVAHTSLRGLPVQLGFRRALGALMRRLPFGVECVMDVVGRVDQRNVRQRLREISGLTPRVDVVLLGQQTKVVCDGCDALE